MTLWQMELVMGCAMLLAAGATFLRLRRLSRTAVAPNLRFSAIFQLVLGTYFVCLATWLGWSNYVEAQSERQQGHTPYTYFLEPWMVSLTFLLLAASLIYFLVQTVLFVRHGSRHSSTEIVDD